MHCLFLLFYFFFPVGNFETGWKPNSIFTCTQCLAVLLASAVLLGGGDAYQMTKYLPPSLFSVIKEFAFTKYSDH